MSKVQEALAWLRRHAPFGALSDVELERLARASRVRHLEGQEVWIRGGSPQREIAYLAQGSTALYRTNPDRTLTLLLGVAHAPGIFGDAECFTGAPWLVSARAESEGVALMIRNEAFLACVQGNRALAYQMYADASIRHAMANHTAQALALYSVDIRLLRTLLDYGQLHGRRDGDDLHVGRKIAQTELAAALGVTTKTVKRTLIPLESEGILERDSSGAFVIRGLSRIAARLPATLLGLTRKFGVQPPPLLSRWSPEVPPEGFVVDEAQDARHARDVRAAPGPGPAASEGALLGGAPGARQPNPQASTSQPPGAARTLPTRPGSSSGAPPLFDPGVEG